ncbi:MAG TPA: hypothetical protein VFP57_01975 [Sphingomicrobium sp.]|nr:hypothetical protein [Sphingomicrobium sp.]
MSRHWKPDAEIARASRSRAPWPQGATAGLVLVAAACAGAVAVLYWAAGPRHAFEDDSAIDWDNAAADLPPPDFGD